MSCLSTPVFTSPFVHRLKNFCTYQPISVKDDRLVEVLNISGTGQSISWVRKGSRLNTAVKSKVVISQPPVNPQEKLSSGRARTELGAQSGAPRDGEGESWGGKTHLLSPCGTGKTRTH